MSDFEIYQTIAISLGLGLLVGVQREWKESDIAGIRTFPLITLLGTLSTIASDGTVGWLSAAGLVALAALLVVANQAKALAKKYDFGMTTEVAVLMMFVVGAALGVGLTGPAIVTGGIIAVLLHWKQKLHGFVARMGEKDLRSLFHLVLIALVILPVLPDQTYGPYDVLNPYSIWRMVVLIVGISMSAYVAYKLLGARTGAVLGGIFGGLISSTATTVSYARQSAQDSSATPMAALVIVIASTIVNVRVLFEVGVVAPQLLRVTLLPIAAILVLMAIQCGVLFIPLRNQITSPPDHENPAQLKAAILFGTLYAVVLLIVAAAKDQFGNEALYLVALISGLTDVDAITLSTAKLFQDDRLDGATAWRVILIATLSNLVFKAGAVAVLGSRRLFFYVAVLFGITILAGTAFLLWWPDVEIAIPSDWFSGHRQSDA